MQRHRSTILICVIALGTMPFVSCGGEEADEGASAAPSSGTSASSSSSGTSSGGSSSSGGDEGGNGGDGGVGAQGGGGLGAGGSGGTGGGSTACEMDPNGLPCESCVKTSCCTALEACVTDAACAVCWGCLETTGAPEQCTAECNGEALLDCIAASCSADCQPT